MTLQLVFNTGTTPLPIDEQGHVLGGGEWGTVETTDPVAKQHLDIDALVKVNESSLDGVEEYLLAPAFVRARKTHKDKIDKQKKVKSLDRDQLEDTLEQADVQLDGDEGLRDLRDAVVADPHTDPPSPKRGSGRTTRKES